MSSCKCDAIIGWKHIKNSCWFNAIMMALLIPKNSNKIFISFFNEYLNLNNSINLSYCKEMSKKNLSYLITKMFNKLYKMNNVMDALLKIIDMYYEIRPGDVTICNNKYYNQKRLNYFEDVSTSLKLPEKINFNKSNNFYIIDKSNHPHKVKPFITYQNFVLTAIILEIHINSTNIHHAISFIKCDEKWYLFDDEIAEKNKPLIKIKYNIKNNQIQFNIIKYEKYLTNFKYIYVINK